MSEENAQFELILDAGSLWSKRGFYDGDMPDEIEGPYQHWDAALEAMIRARLLPLLGGVEIEVWGTSHNPFRATTYPGPIPAHLDGISVSIPLAEVQRYLREVTP